MVNMNPMSVTGNEEARRYDRNFRKYHIPLVTIVYTVHHLVDTILLYIHLNSHLKMYESNGRCVCQTRPARISHLKLQIHLNYFLLSHLLDIHHVGSL